MADTSKEGGVLVEFQPMSPEEMQRTMQFLLASQAQFAADFERLSIKVDGLAGKVDGLTDKVAGVTDAVGRPDHGCGSHPRGRRGPGRVP